jgi:small subunit ribosomal protein S8e
MGIIQSRSKKNATGSRYTPFRAKRQFESGRVPTLTKVGPTKRKVIRIMGGDGKAILLTTDVANVLDTKNKKALKAKIKTVKENPANRNYVRRNIITKGCIIETDIGDVKVTSRPGQDGTVNGILVHN